MKWFSDNNPGPIAIDEARDYFRTIFESLNIQDVNCWIAGGAIRDYVLYGKTNNDIDIYTTSELAQKTIVNKILSKDPKNKICYDNLTVTRIMTHEGSVDVIKRYYGAPDLCIQVFDFTVCCAAIDSLGFFVCHDDFLIHLTERKLKINTLVAPISTLCRLEKYHKYGFSMSKEETKEFYFLLRSSMPDVQFQVSSNYY